jgi:deferrochelatase/peroxidase EfeB
VTGAAVTGVEDGKLQAGIYFRPKVTPPGHFALLFLRVPPHRDAEEVAGLLTQLWTTTYAQLSDGFIDDLPGVHLEGGRLTCMLGFGAAAFEVRGCAAQCPAPLKIRFADPRSQGGGPIVIPEQPGLGDSRIDFDASAKTNPGNAAFAIQFTAESALAVERAVVETWKVLHDQAGGAALEIAGVYTGARREDGRSWIDFHDGLSNLAPDERPLVIPIKSAAAADDWTVGGTYLAFIRLSIDLELWREFGGDEETRREAHERLVGRDKLDGCPIVDFVGHKTSPHCPVGGRIEARGNEDFREPEPPSPTADDTLRDSHVQRANHHLHDDPGSPRSKLIYRQGFPFFEPGGGPLGFRAGLNFVSFQDTPDRLVHILCEPTWFGTTNFGGPDTVATTTNEAANLNGNAVGGRNLITAHAAGFFLVPPDEKPFPGARAFAGARDLVTA